MISTMADLMDSWYTLLSTPAIVYNSKNVNIYKEDVPESEKNHHILLRAEGENYKGNKRSFAFDSVIIVEVITIHRNVAERSIVDTIDNTILARALLSTYQNGLAPKPGMQFLNVTPETTAYIEETEGVNIYYRKITRFRQLVYQTA